MSSAQSGSYAMICESVAAAVLMDGRSVVTTRPRRCLAALRALASVLVSSVIFEKSQDFGRQARYLIGTSQQRLVELPLYGILMKR